MKRILFFYFACCFIFTQAKGSDLVGRVLGLQGTPKYRCIVINTSNNSADVTDRNGFFKIQAEEGDSLIVKGSMNSGVFVYTKGENDFVIDDSRWSFEKRPIVTDDVMDLVNRLFLLERYKDCMVYCRYYMDDCYWNISYENHPYKNWNKILCDTRGQAKDIAKLCYFGAVSAYKHSLKHYYDEMYFEGLMMAKACVALYDDYLHTETPNDSWDANMMYDYIMCALGGLEAIECGNHFLHFMDQKESRRDNKWLEKRHDNIVDVLYENIKDKESLYEEYPLLQFRINSILLIDNVKKSTFKNFSEFHELYLKHLTNIKNLILLSDDYGPTVYSSLNSLASMLCRLVIEDDVRDKLGTKFTRFCMEELIKLQDIIYYLNGASSYSLNPKYTLRDIQNSLQDNDCAMIHFEAPVQAGHLYSQYDLGTRYRNYAFILTKNQEEPELWHRGFINDDKVNDLSRIKQLHSNATRFYYVGTPRMAFIDIAGMDSSIVRLHSLSQLLQHEDNIVKKDVTFIGDINYELTDDTSYPYDNNLEKTDVLKGEEYNEEWKSLRETKEELEQIRSLFGKDVHPICGDEATKDTVINIIRKTKGIVHISTHGYTIFNPEEDIKPEELALKRHIMDNSRLLLSGYNEIPRPLASYITGNDILKIRNFGAQVVFLDACMSGSGSVGFAGSVGIAEAFHTIGAKNIICYLEGVKADIATEFSNKFYMELSKGKSCHSAFYTAKNAVDKNLKIVLWE